MPPRSQPAPPLPIRQALDLPGIGFSVPMSMVAIRTIVWHLLRRTDLALDTRLALLLLFTSAERALIHGLGDEYRDRPESEIADHIEEVARLAGMKIDVRFRRASDGERPKGPRRDDLDAAIAARIRLLQLGDGSQIERGILVYRYLDSVASEYAQHPERVLAHLRAVLPTLLGREADEAILCTVLEALVKRGQRGQRLWEPLAKLVGLAGADALRKAVERAKP